MSSYRQILYQIVFRTKNSRKSINQENQDELFAYIMGIIKNKNCFLYRINGVEDHIHILSDLHPSIALADFVRDIKTSTSIWLKQTGKFPHFEGWADGYAAFTYSAREKEKLINYIKNQQIHHKKSTFEQELRILLDEEGIKIDDRFFP
ncbi:MAG: IS200/IS605 family transposase [Bacteroidales bacterium]|jgi:REP element-mobilizing transposase RayT|nr:IS200/IS605 family transposase [Bacteroidales bacterium]